ncbi:MAG: GNAT family N-acetyltransferase [Nitrospira sp. LK70]|nr:GNAT family N-acetyltransferase [Nitrospira sp. LK70]
MTASTELLQLRPEHGPMLLDLFSIIAADPESRHFHPHPFTAVEADRICGHGGLDRYFALKVNDRLLAYGMLRGWDEGFLVPSIGIYVAPELRGSGAAQLMMQFMHLTARLSGAKQIRLKVYPSNQVAFAFYTSLGYRFPKQGGQDVQLVGTLDLWAPTK